MVFTKENNPMNNPEMRKKLSLMRLGSNNPAWKGKDVGYSGVHNWVRKHLNKPNFCELCNDKSRELHNIDGKYTRDLTQWVWLCPRCHYKLDKNKQKGSKIGGLFTKKRKVIRYKEVEVKEYDTIKEAAEENNINTSNIIQAIKKPRIKSNGYHWRYVSDVRYRQLDKDKLKELGWEKKK